MPLQIRSLQYSDHVNREGYCIDLIGPTVFGGTSVPLQIKSLQYSDHIHRDYNMSINIFNVLPAEISSCTPYQPELED